MSVVCIYTINLIPQTPVLLLIKVTYSLEEIKDHRTFSNGVFNHLFTLQIRNANATEDRQMIINDIFLIWKLEIDMVCHFLVIICY